MFSGTPVCGACLAGSRILGILESGGLPAFEERRVTGLLRGVAGELSDLVESNIHPGVKPKGGATPAQGETSGRTPGPTGGEEVKTEKASPADSYEEEGEEEEEISQDAPEEEAEDKGKSGAKDHRTSEAPEEKKENRERVTEADKPRQEEKRKLHPNFDPHYLTHRLQLFPTGKASAQAPRSRSGVDRRDQAEGSERRRDEHRGGSPRRSHHRDGQKEPGGPG